jgi:NitT/TauT family transport system substrate-binding protein
MAPTRRNVIVTIGAALLAAPGRTAFAQSGLTPIRMASNPVNDVVPVLYAQNAGLFRNAGLEVTMTKANSGSAVAAALAGGAIEIGKVSATTIVTAHARGVGLTIIFPDKMHVSGPQSDVALIVAPDSPIRTGRDLNGKLISVSALKDSTWLGARVWIDANGGDSSTVRFVELPFSAVPAAVEAGRVEAGVTNDPYLTQNVRSGKVRSLGDLLSGFGPRFLETAWVSMADYIAKNRDVVGRFVRVIREAQVWCNGHPSEVADLTAAFTGVDRAAVAATRTSFAVEADPRDMAPYVTASVKYELIPRAFDAADLYLK